MGKQIEGLAAQLNASAILIEKLEAKAARSDVRHLLVRLKARYAIAREKLAALEAEGDNGWENHKAEIWIAWYDLENAIGDVEQAAASKDAE